MTILLKFKWWLLVFTIILCVFAVLFRRSEDSPQKKTEGRDESSQTAAKFSRKRETEKGAESGDWWKIGNLTDSEKSEKLAEFLNSDIYQFPPEEALANLFFLWFENNPETALQELSNLQDESLKLRLGVSSVGALIGNRKMLNEVERLFASNKKSSYSFHIGCSKELASLDPRFALEYGLTENKILRRDSLSAIFRVLAKDELFGFKELVNLSSELSEEERTRALGVAVDYSHSVSFQNYSEIKKITDDKDILSALYVRTIGSSLREDGLSGLDDLVRGSEIPEHSIAKVTEIALGTSIGKVEVNEHIEKMFDSKYWKQGRDEPHVARALCSDWSISNAQEFVESLSDSNPGKLKATGIVASEMVTQDVREATTWISEMPRGKVRDKALLPLLSYLKRVNERESLREWSELLSEVP